MTRVWSIVAEGKVDREFLSKIPIFAGLPPEILDRFIAAGQAMEMPAGCQLIGEGDPARSVFVVCEGALEICKRNASGADTRVAVLHTGDCVGEMALIDIQPRSATVATLTPSTVFRLELSEIGKLHRSHPEVFTFLVMNIAREISRRLRRADQMLADMGVTAQEMWASEAEESWP
ncbi:MAG TPA: cyclic nucleotide-binding domain-containing protein [Polyangia bacterium]|nr:cyclic nucleotide-binding domain-containing protein [Polyangia bacterium]